MAELPLFANSNDSDSLHTDDIMMNALPGEGTSLRQDFAIHLHGGATKQLSGPSPANSTDSVNSTQGVCGIAPDNFSELIGHNYSNSTPSLTGQQNAGKVCSQPHVLLNGSAAVTGASPSNACLEGLQADFNVQNGILQLTSFVQGETSGANNPQTWSNVVTKNILKSNPQNNKETVWTFNSDGSATLKPSREFLVNAQGKKMLFLNLYPYGPGQNSELI